MAEPKVEMRPKIEEMELSLKALGNFVREIGVSFEPMLKRAPVASICGGCIACQGSIL